MIAMAAGSDKIVLIVMMYSESSYFDFRIRIVPYPYRPYTIFPISSTAKDNEL